MIIAHKIALDRKRSLCVRPHASIMDRTGVVVAARSVHGQKLSDAVRMGANCFGRFL
jgi:hypothetical protein